MKPFFTADKAVLRAAFPESKGHFKMIILQISAVVTLTVGSLVALLSSNLGPDVVLAIIATLS